MPERRANDKNVRQRLATLPAVAAEHRIQQQAVRRKGQSAEEAQQLTLEQGMTPTRRGASPVSDLLCDVCSVWSPNKGSPNVSWQIVLEALMSICDSSAVC